MKKTTRRMAFLIGLFSQIFIAKTMGQGSADGPFRIAGRVVDFETKKAIAGASVCFENQWSVADSAGRFAFMASDTLVYYDSFGARAVGYEPQNLPTNGYLLFPKVAVSVCGTRSPRDWQQPVELFLLPKAVELNGDLVITARRKLFENLVAPQAVTAISEKAFAEKAARSVPESLMNEAGVFVQKTNHGGGSPIVRGLTGQHVLAMVDGIRLNSATTRSGPNQYLNAVDPAAIGSLEVVRGSGSVEHGSDALGGVVHLKTPDFFSPLGWHGALEARTATAGMENSAAGRLAFSKDGFGAMASAAFRDFGDLRGGRGVGFQRPTGYRQSAFFGKIQNARRLPFSAVWQDQTQFDVPIFHKIQLENFARNHVSRQRRAFGYASFTPFSNSWKMEKLRPLAVQIWRQNLDEARESKKNGSAKMTLERDQTETLGARANWAFRPRREDFLGQLTFQTSLETTLDRVASDRKTVENEVEKAERGLYPDGSRMASGSLFAQISFDDWKKGNGQIGLRGSFFRLKMTDAALGSVALEPSALVWNASYSYPIFRRRTHVFAGASTAFRAPNVDDLGSLGVVDFRYELPNFDLKAEKSTAFEAGLKHRTAAFSASAVGFFTRLEDLIGRVRTGDSLAGYAVYRKENFEKGWLSGAEAEAEWRFRLRWSAFGNAAFSHGQNVSKNEPLRRVPPVFGKIGAAWQPRADLKFRLETLFTGRQNRLAQADIDDNRIDDDGTAGWATLNFQVLFERKKGRVGLDFQNLLNAKYRTHGSGVDGVGRSIWVVFGWRF